MEIVSSQAIVSMAIAYKKQYAVYVANHIDDFDGVVWKTFLDIVHKRYPEKANDIICEVIGSAIFFFDDYHSAVDFYTIFESNVIYSSGLYAVLYDPSGQAATENT